MRAKAKKILVIGGAGYVGCVVVDELLKRGYAVRIFDRLIYGEQGLRDVRDRVEVVVGDMRAMDQSVFLPQYPARWPPTRVPATAPC